MIKVEVFTTLSWKPFKADLEFVSDIIVSDKPKMLHLYTKKTQLGIPLKHVLYYSVTEIHSDV